MADYLYNLTAVQESNGLIDLVVAANTASQELLMAGVLISIFIVFLFMLRKNDIADSVLVSGFVCFLFSVFLRTAGLIDFMYVLGFGLLTASMGIYKVMVKTG